MPNLVLYKDTPQILEDFGSNLVTRSKRYLGATRARHRFRSKFADGNLAPATKIVKRRSASKNLIASRRLYNSVQYYMAGLKLYISFNEYGVMLDRGSDGSGMKQFGDKSYFSGTDISYGSYKNMKANIDSWIRARRIVPRSSDGKRLRNNRSNRKKMAFLIRRSLLNRGVEPMYWFTDAYNALADDLPDDLIFGMYSTMDDAFDNIFNKNTQ